MRPKSNFAKYNSQNQHNRNNTITPYVPPAEGGGSGSAMNQYNTKESFFSAAQKTGESFHKTKSTIRQKKFENDLGGVKGQFF